MSDSDLYKFERVLANRAAVLQLLDAILQPVKAGAETDAIFASGVPSPLDDERRTITSFITKWNIILRVDVVLNKSVTNRGCSFDNLCGTQ